MGIGFFVILTCDNAGKQQFLQHTIKKMHKDSVKQAKDNRQEEFNFSLLPAKLDQALVQTLLLNL